jgi:hypothetical protein
MGKSLISQRAASEVHEQPKDGLHQGVGALLLLAGLAMVFSESREEIKMARGKHWTVIPLLLVGLWLPVLGCSQSDSRMNCAACGPATG